MATESDRAAIAKLMATVARLMMELSMVNTKLVVSLQTNRARRGSCGGRDRTRRGQEAGARSGSGKGNGSGAPSITGTSAPTMAEEKDLKPPINYCWTCGLVCRHNSAKCTNPATSDIYTATKRNMQVGAEATK